MMRALALIAVGTYVAVAQPPPPPPPAFMTMKGLPLSCFANANFEQGGQPEHAKSQCVTGRVSVSADREGIISFRCGGPEMAHTERFQVASKAEWTAWAKYLNR
jgi:hypothetical protein